MTNRFQQIVSPHVHVGSFDSASTPERFLTRQVELGGSFLSVTDHGTLEATRKVYDLCAKGGAFHGKITPILGMEAYFRDDDDPILHAAGVEQSLRYRNQLTNKVVAAEAYEKLGDEKALYVAEKGFWGHMKYSHLTMHALDEEALSTLSKLLSKADLTAEHHGSERKPIFGWKELEELGSKNITFCSGCLIGMVSRHLLQHNDQQTAMKYYERLRSTVKPGNFYVELFPHTCDRNWDEATFIKRGDTGVEERYPVWKKLLTNHGTVEARTLAMEFQKDPIRASEKHMVVKGVMTNRKMLEHEPYPIVGARNFEGYIVNECRPWAPDGDVQLGVNKFIHECAKRYGDPILVSDDSHFANPKEKLAQDVRLGQNGSWRFANSHHLLSSEEAFGWFNSRMGISEAEFTGWVQNSLAFGERFKSFKFTPKKALPTSFYPADTLTHTWNLIHKHGRMNWNSQVDCERLASEIELLHNNGTIDLLPYFFVAEEVADAHLKNGDLIGPGRGSAGGLLLASLLGITCMDPIRYGLSKDRFLTQTRISSGKLPDIDSDFPNRNLLVDPNDSSKGWLRERFGDCVAQISVDSTLRLKSAIKDVVRIKYGVGSPHMLAVSEMTKQLPVPPQGIEDRAFVFGYQSSDGDWVPGIVETDPNLQRFSKDYPDEWETVQLLLGLSRQKGRHASAFLIADEPIQNFIPLTTVSDTRVTQFTANQVESSGGIKMDFLVVNSIGDIQNAIRLIQDRHGKGIDWTPARLKLKERGDVPVPYMELNGRKVPHVRCIPYNGSYVDVWDLPEEQEVFDDFVGAKTETVFQFNKPGPKKYLRLFDRPGRVKGLASIEDLATFTALDRPGGLDNFVSDGQGGQHNMLVEFAHRASGGVPNGDPELVAALQRMVPETRGVLVYQEQLTRIFQQVGGTTGSEADEFRIHISKKQLAKVIKDKEIFMRGAPATLGSEAVANKMWETLEFFARYGFNKSHAVAYSIISYACMWLKHHYPLEWWTAVLRNADRNEINSEFWAYAGKLIDLPTIGKSTNEFYITEDNRIQAPFWLLKGIGDKAQDEIVRCGPYTDLNDFCMKIAQSRFDRGTNVTKLKVNRKTGETTEVVTRKLATSAVNSRVASTLIAAGVMDALFDKIQIGDQSFEPTLAQKFSLYADAEVAAVKAITGKAPKRKVLGESYGNLTPLVQYQMRKQILPALTEPLNEIAETLAKDRISHTKNGRAAIYHKPFGYSGHEYWTIASREEIEWLQATDVPMDITFAAVGYVSDERRWMMANKFAEGGPKQLPAVELTIDVEGLTVKGPKWPGKFGLPPPLDKPLNGAVVIALCKKKKGKGTRIEDVIVLQSPLNTKPLDEESAEGTQDE